MRPLRCGTNMYPFMAPDPAEEVRCDHVAVKISLHLWGLDGVFLLEERDAAGSRVEEKIKYRHGVEAPGCAESRT